MDCSRYKKSKTSSGKLDNFKRYCEEKKIPIPVDDLKWIDKQLDNFKQAEHRAILRRYLDEWLLGYSEAGEDSIKAVSVARRRANLWLLEFGEKKMR